MIFQVKYFKYHILIECDIRFIKKQKKLTFCIVIFTSFLKSVLILKIKKKHLLQNQGFQQKFNVG